MTTGEREDRLRHAVRGMDLTADDERAIAWLSRCEQSTVETVTRMFDRVRRAGFTDSLDLENALIDRKLKEGKGADHG